MFNAVTRSSRPGGCVLVVVLAATGGSAKGCDTGSGGDTERSCRKVGKRTRCTTEKKPKPSESQPLDPCRPGKSPTTAVRVYFSSRDGRIYRLRCGNPRQGYRHIVTRGRTVDRDTLTCIGNVIKHGTPEPDQEKGKTAFEWFYGPHPKRGIGVVVIDEPAPAGGTARGDIVTAYKINRGQWADCARAR
jgi:hypothetical protein